MDSGSLPRRLLALAELAEDFRELRAAIHTTINAVVPYDIGALSTLDPTTLLWTSCFLVGAAEDPERERRLFALEFEGDDVNRYRDLALQAAPAGALYLSTEGEPTRSRRYRELLTGLGVVDELRMVCRVDGHCWGALTVYRLRGGDPFTAKDVTVCAEASSSVASLLRLGLLHSTVRAPAAAGLHPGLLVVGPNGTVSASTPAASAWLDLLDDRDRIPSAVRSVAAQSRAEGGYSWARVPVGAGRWIVLHAAPMKYEGAEGDGATSVIVEEALATKLADVIAATYGFTPRESEIVGLVAHGNPNKRIASTLGISPYTVQDHMKSVFTKAGIGSRGELLAMLQGEFFAPRFAAHDTPDAYGWYLDAVV